jgi:peptide/nickel transport system substrate-binding protein
VELRAAPLFRRALLLAPALVVLALGAGLLEGCSNLNLTVPTVATQATVPGGQLLDTNGVVTVGVPSLPTNFNPSTPAGDNPVTQMVMQQVWPQPFVTDPTFNVATSGLLVRAEVEGITPFRVVYDINPDAVWSDGVPITEADFAYAWREHLAHSANLPNSGLVAGYRDIRSVTGSNAGRTVTVTFARPFAEWQALFANLVPDHIAEKYGWSRAFQGFSPSRIVSGGAFEVTAFSPGKSLTLSRNPRYWGAPAHVAEIRFVVEPSTEATVAAVDSGKVSIAEIDTSLYAPWTIDGGLLNLPTIRRRSGTHGAHGGRTRNVQLSPRPGTVQWSSFAGGQIWQLCFNQQDAVLSQLAMRQAIEHSLDRSEIVADSEDLIDPKIRVSTSRFTLSGESANPTSPGTTPIAEHDPVAYRPAQARRLFEAAGWLPGLGGVLRLAGGAGEPLRLTLLEPSDSWAIDEAGAVIQAELRALGVTVVIEQEPLDKMLSSTLPAGDYQLALAPFNVSTALTAVAPQYTDSVLPSGGLPTPGRRVSRSAGFTALSEPWSTLVPRGTEPGAVAAGAVTRDVLGVDDPLVSRRLAAAVTQLNPPIALGDLQRADTRIWNEVYTVPLFQEAFELIHSVRVDNVSESPTWAGVMWDAQDWAILKRPPATTTTAVSVGAG